jgi:hypothetical protein
MYQIGKMLQTVSSGMQMPRVFNIVVKQMLNKSITAEQALQKLP